MYARRVLLAKVFISPKVSTLVDGLLSKKIGEVLFRPKVQKVGREKVNPIPMVIGHLSFCKSAIVKKKTIQVHIATNVQLEH